MKTLPYLVLFLFSFLLQSKTEAQISKLAKPDLKTVTLHNLRLKEDQVTITFDLEFKNIGLATANLTGIKTRCFLSTGNDEIVITDPNIIHIGTSEKGYRGDDTAPLAPGQSRIFKGLTVTTFEGKDLILSPALWVYLDVTEVIEESNDNNNVMYYTHELPKPADLKLEVSNVTSAIKTNAETGAVYRLYTFTCTITNIGEGVAIINNSKNLIIQSYRATACNTPNIEGAGGRLVGGNLTRISPGESVVLQDQTANQPSDATTKIRVELKYGGIDSYLKNNVICLMP
jgi:hypothetical protein